MLMLHLLQVKELMHRKDEAEALTEELKSLAGGTNATLASQKHHLVTFVDRFYIGSKQKRVKTNAYLF